MLLGGVFLNILSLAFVVLVLIVMVALASAISIIMSRQREDLRAQQRLLAALGDYAAVHEQDERRMRYAFNGLAAAIGSLVAATESLAAVLGAEEIVLNMQKVAQDLQEVVGRLDEPPQFLAAPLTGEHDVSDALARAADAIRMRAANGGLRLAKEEQIA